MEAFIAQMSTSFIDVPNKVAIAIYFAGCSIRCPGCQNKQLWERESGVLMNIESVLQKIEENNLAESVVFLGGEPTDQIEFLIALCQQIKRHKALYTGREFEDLPPPLIKELDMIICGPYREDLPSEGFPASRNQRFLIKEGNSWICQTSQ